MAGFLLHYETGLSYGDHGVTTCINPLSPAVGMQLQMTSWCMLSLLLTRVVFSASYADTKKYPLPWESKTATGQCAVYGWLWAVGEPAANKDHISPGLCSSKADHSHVLCL